MGRWAESQFGVGKLPSVCFMFAGTTPKKWRAKIISQFDEVLFHKDTVTHNFIVRKGRKKFAIVFQVYGAPLATDIVHTLANGGVKKIIFLGYAYGGFHNLEVGAFILPERVRCLDTMTTYADKKTRFVEPNKALRDKIESTFRRHRVAFYTGTSVSVPCIFFGYREMKKEVDRTAAIGLEMELSSVLYFAKKLKMKAAGVLVISDNKDKRLFYGEAIEQRSKSLNFLMKVLKDIKL